MMQRLPQTDEDKSRNDEQQKGLSNAVSRLEKAPQKHQIKGREDQQNKGQKQGVGRHEHILGVHRRMAQQKHPDAGQNRHQQKGRQLKKAHHQVFGFDRASLPNGEENGVQNIVGLPPVLECLKNAEADEKRAAQDGVPRNKGHKGKGQKQVGEQGRGQPQFLIQHTLHGAPPFHSRA